LSLGHGSLGASALIERLLASGLRGRGGGWFPTGRKWQAVRAERGRAFVVANGAEGEPGSIKDRFVMTARPRQVIEGLALAAHAVGAEECLIYLKGSFERAAAALEASVLDFSSDLRIDVRRGEEGYVAGEETAILETLEGRRPWPRPKPPLPYAVGFAGRPTLVQNVETLSLVPAAIQDPEAFRTRQTTLVSLWGTVRRPGCYEVVLGTPLERIIDEHGLGTTDGVGMIFPGGPSGAPLSPSQKGTPLDPEALSAAGSALGTGSILVIGQSACPISVGVSLARFFEREACGQCPPCTVGTKSLSRVLQQIEEGEARPGDLQTLAEVAGFMSGHGYCAHCKTASAAVGGLLSRFKGDVELHLKGPCPRPGRQVDPFDPVSPERRRIESMAGETHPS